MIGLGGVKERERGVRGVCERGLCESGVRGV